MFICTLPVSIAELVYKHHCVYLTRTVGKICAIREASDENAMFVCILSLTLHTLVISDLDIRAFSAGAKKRPARDSVPQKLDLIRS